MGNDVRFRLAVDGAAAVSQQLDGISKSFDAMGLQAGSAMKALGGMMGGFSAALTIGKLVEVQRQFDVLNSSLITVTGSGMKAAQEFDWIKRFAATTPYQLNEVTQAFVKMKAIGLDASEKALSSYGNTASAMGKNINQMIEAVADAATGEFERLKEFGIKAKQNGDQVSLTFQGVTTNIGNNAAEITQYLQQIGNVEFAGAMEERAKTLDGAMSNLTDSINTLFHTANQAGFAAALTNDVKTINTTLQALNDTMLNSQKAGDGMVKQLANAAGFVIGTAAVGTLNSAANGLNWTINALTGNVFKLDENVRLLPASLQTNEQRAAALGAQLQAAEANLSKLKSQLDKVPDNIYLKSETYQAYLLTLQLREAKEAQDKMASVPQKSQSESRLKASQALQTQIDKDTAAVAALSQKLSGVPKEYIDTMAEIGRLHASGALKGEAYSQAIEKAHSLLKKSSTALSESAKGLVLYSDLMDKSVGFEAGWSESVNKLRAALDGKTISQDQYNAAIDQLLKKQPLMVEAEKLRIDLAKENTKAVDDLFDAQEKLRLANEEQIKTARTLLEQIEFETRLLGMNAEQRAIATMERDLEAKGIIKGTQAYEAYITKLREAMAIKTGKEAGIKAADDLADANKKAAEESSKYWEDSLMRAFESGKGFFESLWDTIKNTLKTQVLKVTVQGIMGTLGIGASGVAAAGGSGGSTLGAAANLSTLYNSLAGGVNVAMQSGVALAGLAAKAGSQMVAGFAGGMVSTASMASASAAASAGGSAMAGLIAGSVMNGLSGYGISKGLSGGYSIDGLNVNAIAGIASMIPGVGPIAGLIGAAVNRAFGHGATEVQAQGTRGTFAASGDFSGTNYTNYKQAGGWFTQDKHWSDTSAVDQKQITAWSDAFAGIKVASAGMAASLGLATDKIAAYSKTVDVAAGTTAEQMTALFVGMADDMATASAPGLEMLVRVGETASVTLGRLSSSLVTVNQWLGALDQKLMAVSLIGGDFASQLADTFGGIDKLTTASKAYYDSFWTDAERLADTAVNVAKGLALVGVAMPANKLAFRDVVSGLDLATEAGRNTYAVMLALAPEFATVADAVVSMTNSLTAEAKRIRALMAGDTPASYAQAQSAFAIGTAQARAGDATALQTLPALSQALLTLAQANAVTSADLARVRGATAGSLETTAGMAAASFGLTLPSFDVGTNRVPRDMIAMIHEGEAIIPRPFNPQTFGSGGSGGASSDAVVAELRALRQDNTAMRAELRAIAEHASKTSRILSRVTRDGESMQTVAG